MFYPKTEILNQIESGEIEITPFSEEYLDPASYELHLGEEIEEVKPLNTQNFAGNNPKEKEITKHTIEDNGYILPPGTFVVAKTKEKIIIKQNTLAMFDGKASLAQIGLFTHISSTLIEPGFKGNITCEIFNASKYPVILCKGQKIGQIVFAQVI